MDKKAEARPLAMQEILTQFDYSTKDREQIVGI